MVGSITLRYNKKRNTETFLTTPRSQIDVVVIDDSARFLQAICAWITDRPELRLVGTASDGADAVRLVREHAPRLVLMDAFMPGLDGFEACRLIKTEPNAPKVVIVSLNRDTTLKHESWLAGADEFIPKSELTERLLAVLSEIDLFPSDEGAPRQPDHRHPPDAPPKLD